MKKIVILITIMIAVLGIANSVYAATGTTNSETTRLREESNSDSRTLTLIPIKQEMEITAKEGEWYKVIYNGIEGYIFAELLDVNGEVVDNSAPNQEGNETTEEPSTSETPNEEQETNENTQNKNPIVNLPANMKTKNQVNVKITPLINSSDIGKVEAEKEVTVTEVINDWCYIIAENTSGWTRTTNLAQIVEVPVVAPVEPSQDNINNDIDVETKIGYVSATSLYVREQPTTDSKIIHTAYRNEEVEITQQLDGWYAVNVANVQGYVAAKYISDTKVETTSRGSNETRLPLVEDNAENETIDTAETIEPVENTNTEVIEPSQNEQINTIEPEEIIPEETQSEPAQEETNNLGEQIVEYAKQYLGCKYVSGGTTPKGFDCSGFTQYVYAHFGISITRTSKTQAKDGEYIDKEDLQLGDLIIFNNDSNSSIGHVGIYVGDNSFIHAANPKKGVVITELSNSYYKARYVSSRRVF